MSLVKGWTEAKVKSFITSALRAAFRRWPPKQACINKAYVETKVNEKSGRQAKHYRCEKCLGLFPRTQVQADHIEPIVNPETGFEDWNTWIRRGFVGEEGFQCMCLTCHKIKTKEERKKL